MVVCIFYNSCTIHFISSLHDVIGCTNIAQCTCTEKLALLIYCTRVYQTSLKFRNFWYTHTLLQTFVIFMDFEQFFANQHTVITDCTCNGLAMPHATMYVHYHCHRCHNAVCHNSNDEVEYGLTSYQIHYRSYRDRFLQVKCPTNSVKALKEDMVLRISFNPIRSISPFYTNIAHMQLTKNTKYTHITQMNLQTVKWAKWNKTQYTKL